MDLEVKLPMILELDDKGAVNLANNWSVDGRTLHMDVRNHSICEFKDLGLLVVKSVPGDENDADIFTKSTLAKVFERHTYLSPNSSGSTIVWGMRGKSMGRCQNTIFAMDSDATRKHG